MDQRQCPCGTQEEGRGESQLGPVLDLVPSKAKYTDGVLALDLGFTNPIDPTQLAVSGGALVIKTPTETQDDKTELIRELSNADSALGSSVDEPRSKEPVMEIQLMMKEKHDYPQTGTFLRHVGEISPQQIIEKDGIQEFCGVASLSGRPLRAYYGQARINSTRLLNQDCNVHIMCVCEPANQAVVMTINPKED